MDTMHLCVMSVYLSICASKALPKPVSTSDAFSQFNGPNNVSLPHPGITNLRPADSDLDTNAMWETIAIVCATLLGMHMILDVLALCGVLSGRLKVTYINPNNLNESCSNRTLSENVTKTKDTGPKQQHADTYPRSASERKPADSVFSGRPLSDIKNKTQDGDDFVEVDQSNKKNSKLLTSQMMDSVRHNKYTSTETINSSLGSKNLHGDTPISDSDAIDICETGEPVEHHDIKDQYKHNDDINNDSDHAVDEHILKTEVNGTSTIKDVAL